MAAPDPLARLSRPSLSSRPSTPKEFSPAPHLRSSTIDSSASSVSSVFNSPTTFSANIEDTRSLICRAFVPHIAVHVSADVDELVREKGFRGGFAELLRPFGEDLQGRINVRDSQGLSASHDDFGVRFVGLADVAASGERWETGMAHAAMNGGSSRKGEETYVGGSIEEVEELMDIQLGEQEDGAETELLDEGVDGDRERRSPYWRYLRRLLSALPVSPHETFSHPVACVIAISSRNKSPIEELRNLYTTGTNAGLPSYVHAEYLRYYVLIHDEDRDDITKSNLLYEQMRRHFGVHCHILRLRSGKTVISDEDAQLSPAPEWLAASEELAVIRNKDDIEGQSSLYLPETDVSGIRTMVREMVQLSVVPFMERCMATWNDQVASRRKGISGRFMSLSKRYFTSSSSRNSGSASSNYDPTSGSYAPSTPEAQMRKLADYAFMLRDYRLAHSIYDLLRTDFNNDKAWKYHAAVQEMTVISLLLITNSISHKTRQDTIDPHLDLALYSYLNRCSSTFSALRCLLVTVELLRLRSNCADDASKWAIRALDIKGLGQLSRALITERVGDCYRARDFSGGSTHIGTRKRKSAMWKMLAAKEWVQAGKIPQARRCLDVALPMYETSRFEGIDEFVGRLKELTAYTPLLDDGDERVGKQGDGADDDEEEVVEKVELDNKRMSLVVSPPVMEMEEEKKDDSFVQS
ncbi:hypothetical protein EX30DRAFT_303512 [Ascodesmis nigricans]|uniref:Uncharacterized protein n=1 Tax=Ascodesmis nigricans TaxID=341454 RepID=A0A4V3SJD9_9PEZI|nr:hypothetical protein EX30DRAFT_303512 [Ascodesmis nigricans]